MKRIFFSLFLLVAILATSLMPVVASSGAGDVPGAAPKEDDRMDPLTIKQRELRQEGLEAKLAGKAPDKVKQVARGQYVELDLEGEGQIWTVMGEFSDFPHNKIAQPNRAVNNSTLWVANFDRQHYLDLLFNDTPGANSMRNFYKEQSSGRYAVTGDVTDWIPVGNHLQYDDNPDANVWLFLEDTVNGWYAQQKAAGKTDAEINAYLAKMDVRDRYDYDGDGNFNEPDGYIDTFQSIHAGEGEEAGGGALGAEAIWSHSWYARSGDIGKTGPSFNKYGGIQVGNSDFWVGKYTIQPENGGVGVFTHEFGHDLGLPDLYDTAGGDNGTAFWTLMSSGSWMGDGTQDIGSMSSHMGAWEKYQLGWLNYTVASANKKAEYKLGPMEFNTKQAQGIFVILPKKAVTTQISAPYAGSSFYYSGTGDKLDYFMYKAFNLPAGATLAAKVKYSIELDWDYAYVVYSTDNGVTWTPVETNLSTSTDPNGQNKGFGITGRATSQWVDLTANLPAGNVLLGFRYWTDEATSETGFMVDDINITGSPLDGAEVDAGWTFKPATGFHVTSGTEAKLYSNYYVLEYRTYLGYDSTLKTGPYFFGYTGEKANMVDHFSYQDGLLINYWDTSQKNNNTSSHKGAGLILPIDAHPKNMVRPDGINWRNRVQSYDATFTLDRADTLKLHLANAPVTIAGLPAVTVFDDRTQYWDAANPWNSVKNPSTGTQIRIQGISTQDGFMQIEIRR